MNFNKLKLWSVGAAAVAIMSTGCNKLSDFGDTNVNPNGSTYISTSTLISTTQVRLGNSNFGTVTTTGTPSAELLSGLMAQYFAEPTYPGASRFAGTSLQVNYNGAYQGPLNDLQTVILRNTDPVQAVDAARFGSNAGQIAMARIMKVFIFWQLTDKWGDIPYSEALKGAANLTPKYDSQESIYKDMLKELGEAVDQFDGTNSVQGDLIYAGNETKWKKFANSMRAVMALRMSKVYPGPADLAAVEFNKALTSSVTNGGMLISNDDNFQMYYPANANPFTNPFYAPANSNDNGVSKTFTDLLTGLSDTRQSAWVQNTNGVPYGLANPVPAGTWAKILAPQFKTQVGTMVLFNAASVLLAHAEAAERGWIPGGSAQAKLYYDAGVTASFNQWGLASVPGAYLTTGPANFDTGAGLASIGGASVPGSNALTPTALKRIQLQQYLAFYPIGWQAWSNWRRTGVPDLKPSTDAFDPAIPRRLTYGTIEYQLNAAQVGQAGANMGGDDQNSRVWWDKP
ncbi:MAG: SusD/RagB family nutrient-binding outer membrane lipoprotein [Pedobacter sp.]|nr:MAG: SusD/RagB family nutrient-binding outer membrane lipoprotein [Pedobacter sp.]